MRIAAESESIAEENESPPFDPQSSNHRFRLLVSDIGMILFLPALTTRLVCHRS
jgi:hypothetical protein